MTLPILPDPGPRSLPPQPNYKERFASSVYLLGVGPASQRVFSAGKTEVLEIITGVVVLVVGLGRRGGFFLSELGLITLLGSNATATGADVATTHRENRILMSSLPGTYNHSPQVLPVNQLSPFPSSVKMMLILDSPGVVQVKETKSPLLAPHLETLVSHPQAAQ